MSKYGNFHGSHFNETLFSLVEDISERTKAMESELQHKIANLERETMRKENRIAALEEELMETKRSLSKENDLHTKIESLLMFTEDCVSNQKKILKRISKLDTKLSEPLNTTSSSRHDDDEFAWSQGMTLMGDELWKSFSHHKEIESKIKKHMPSMRICSVEGQSLFGLYDEKRNQVVVPLPAESRTFVLSVGSRDLRENSLINLKKGSLESVRKHNLPILLKKASTLKSLIQKLLSISPSVILIFPPRGYDERIEIHHQWEELAKETLKTIPYPQLKILHVPSLISRTEKEYESEGEFRREWFGSTSPGSALILGRFGADRLLDEIHRVTLSQSPLAIGMDADWPIVSVGGDEKKASLDEVCGRCTRFGHPSENCKSIQMLCKVCQTIGHFEGVHSLTDESLRSLVVRTIGFNIYDDECFDSESDPKRIKLS